MRLYISNNYNITEYSLKQAKRLGVGIKLSTTKGKKLDVYKGGKKLVSIGAAGYSVYPTYIKTHGKAYADKRRENYSARHKHDKGLAGFYARELLW